jgi:hypothetical protein
MGDISLWTWVQASFVLLVCAFMGGAIGWGFGADHAAKSWKKRLETREEAFRNHWRTPGPVRWYWWTGRDDSRHDRNEWLVGVVAETEGEAKSKLDPARIAFLDKARAKGVKELATHVLVAHSREDIHVRTI